MAALPPELLEALGGLLGSRIVDTRPVAGGDINEAWRLRAADGDSYFLKTNAAERADMFSAERDALDALGATGVIRVPAPVHTGVTASRAWLLLEWLNLEPASEASDESLGRSLAAMHRHTSATFGWHRDNTIGSAPQINSPGSDWARFYANQRLRPQLVQAGLLNEGAPLLERLCSDVESFLGDYRPVPALLHGDLWGGNRGRLPNHQPVIFDPATYYGDRETDVAMTRLFGGFNERFYSAYNELWPLEPGYERRQVLYNLYHVLNHCNLFGGSYCQQASGMIRQLLDRQA